MIGLDSRTYRGNGTTQDGRMAATPGEPGVYRASPDLVTAVNTMLAVEQPLLVTGDAGTGKTMLAYSIQAELEIGKIEVFPVRSDHQGRDLLYDFDNLQRFYDAQVGTPRARDRRNYLTLGPLGRAICSEEPVVLLIDEIDKAPRDFPNDLLNALDKMTLSIPEIGVEVHARHRPIVVITSNRESQLPDPFLRRCVFHHIEFPNTEELKAILHERLGDPGFGESLLSRIVSKLEALREIKGLQKMPATAEMLTWARAIRRLGTPEKDLDAPLDRLPHLGTLLKAREDFELVKRLAR